MLMIGKYGVRNYQVTDARSKYSFQTYKVVRIITTLLMGVAICAYTLYGYYYKNYNCQKIHVILGITLIYASESIEDVYWGAYQKNNRLDLGAKIFSLRWIIIMIISLLTMISTTNIVLSIYAGSLTSWLVMIVLIRMSNHHINYSEIHCTNCSRKQTRALLKECCPLAMCSFLYYYIVNVSKYAMDGLVPEAMQAAYGYISMPVFVISVISAIIYQPMLVPMSIEWSNKNLSAIKIRIIKQCKIILGLTLICCIGAFFIGIPFLSMLYGVNLQQYKSEFMILLFGSGVLALGNFFSSVITIIRKQSQALYSYIIVAAIALLFSRKIISKYSMLGASISNTLWIICFTILFILITIKTLNK